MRILLLLLMPMFCSAKTIELGFPDLAHRIKVVLPDGYDPGKKYPAVFYYHGSGGEPDTSLIRSHVDGREWIVVGMTYYQPGKFTYTAQTLEKERILLRSVRRNLAEKRGLDQGRCYVAGFSKGGWISDLLLQTEPTLAGGVILGAGHLSRIQEPTVKYRNRKPVFVGTGRLDGNFPFGLRAVVFHRKSGAQTTFESWQEIAHSFPREGSTALQQWFSMRVYKAAILKPVARKEMAAELVDAEKLEPYPRWMKLRQLKEYPYSRLLGDPWMQQLSSRIKSLESNDPIKLEAAFLMRHRQLLSQEINESSVLGMAKINMAYQNLIKKAPDTRQAILARHDHQRAQQLYIQYKEQHSRKKKQTSNKDPFAPIEPENPESKRQIPRNPLVR